MWDKSHLPGNYLSKSGTHTAELRPAGYYPEVGAKLQRHYAIRPKNSSNVIGTAKTLKDANRYLPD